MSTDKYFLPSNYYKFLFAYYNRYRNNNFSNIWPNLLPAQNMNMKNSLEFSLLSIVKRYDLLVSGIIQVGAHKGQELESFIQHGIKHVVLIEPVPTYAKILEEKFGDNEDIKVLKVALGAEKGSAKLNIASNDGQSSSILTSSFNFKIGAPEVKIIQTIDVVVERMDDVIDDFSKFNTLLIDVEGYELEVLKGSLETLKHIEMIFIEVNKIWVRKGNPSIHKIDKFLSDAGFQRIFTRWWDFWGDAFYMKIE